MTRLWAALLLFAACPLRPEATQVDAAIPDMANGELSGIDLAGADLTGVDLTGVDLGGAVPDMQGQCVAGWTGTIKSCSNPALSCGLAGSMDSCCTTILVPGGEWFRRDKLLNDNAWVNNFKLDKYEVTVGRFKQFHSATPTPMPVPNDGEGKHSCVGSGDGWQASTFPANLKTGFDMAPKTGCNWNKASNDNLPMDCVTWYEAYAFCIWDGGYLPTDAEWVYAAQGGSEERKYPWGNTPDPSSDCSYARFASGACGTVAAVGSASAGAGRWGHLDLAGNLWEWALDEYTGTASAPPVGTCINCAAFSGTLGKVIRGGSFSVSASNLALWSPGGLSRSLNSPSLRATNFGFRCARTP